MQFAILSSLVVSGAINYMDRAALAVANPFVRHDLHLTSGEMGILLAIFPWTYAFGQLVVGGLTDRVPPRRILSAALVVWSLAQAACGFARGLFQFAMLRALLAVGESPQFPVGAKAVRTWFAEKERGTATGIFNSASSLGSAIAPPLATALILTAGWRAMFALLGIAGLPVALLWWMLYRHPTAVALDPPDREYLTEALTPPTGPAISFGNWPHLFRSGTMWGMILGNCALGYMVSFYATWLPQYLESDRHISVAQTGWAASIPYIFGFAGSLIGGWCCDRLERAGFSPANSRKLPIVVSTLGGALFTAFAVGAGDNALAVSAITVAVFCCNIASASVWALAVAVAPREGVASVGSVQNFGGFVGAAVAPVATGFIVQATHSFSAALVIAVAAAALSALIYGSLVRGPISMAD